MTDLRKAAEMALKCLNYHWDYFEDESGDGLYVLEAKKALRQALANEALDRMVAENERLGLYEDEPVKRDSSSWVGMTEKEKSA